MNSARQWYAVISLIFVVLTAELRADDPVLLGVASCEPRGGAGQLDHCVNIDDIHIPPHVTKVQLRWFTRKGWGPNHSWDQPRWHECHRLRNDGLL